ncbi:hypothetical protein A3849_26690 [Paenibacillus sp. P46E]|nr:hypothetical protein A3849_26690 [Paenibacillus sp. P46E]
MLKKIFIGKIDLTIYYSQHSPNPLHILLLTLSRNLMLNAQLVSYHGDEFRVGRFGFGDINGIAEQVGDAVDVNT